MLAEPLQEIIVNFSLRPFEL